jgi:hypothetical protein
MDDFESDLGRKMVHIQQTPAIPQSFIQLGVSTSQPRRSPSGVVAPPPLDD